MRARRFRRRGGPTATGAYGACNAVVSSVSAAVTSGAMVASFSGAMAVSGATTGDDFTADGFTADAGPVNVGLTCALPKDGGPCTFVGDDGNGTTLAALGGATPTLLAFLRRLHITTTTIMIIMKAKATAIDTIMMIVIVDTPVSLPAPIPNTFAAPGSRDLVVVVVSTSSLILVVD